MIHLLGVLKYLQVHVLEQVRLKPGESFDKRNDCDRYCMLRQLLPTTRTTDGALVPTANATLPDAATMTSLCTTYCFLVCAHAAISAHRHLRPSLMLLCPPEWRQSDILLSQSLCEVAYYKSKGCDVTFRFQM